MKLETEIIRVNVPSVIYEMVDVNKKKYVITAKGWFRVERHFGSFSKYVFVRTGKGIIEIRMRRDEPIEMDCGTLVNPKNIVKAVPKVETIKQKVFLKTTKISWWDTEETIEDITAKVFGYNPVENAQ